MTTLLILTVLVLVAIAIWQMTKIFELSQLKTDASSSEIANDSDNNYNGYLLFAFLIFIYGITIFSFAKYYKFLLPEAASEHGAGYDQLMWVSFAIIFFVQTITQALLHYYGYKYRRLIDINRSNVMGLDESDPNAADDVIVKELHLPVGRKVNFMMRSQDVLHSAYMPHFRAQMNCVPGMITQFSFTPTITTEEMRLNPEVVDKVKRTNKLRAEWAAEGRPNSEPWEFDYILLCNKICGRSHYNMQMKIIVETEEEYNAWMAKQTTFEQTIAPAE